jgi:hypothetical protein
VKRYFHQGLKAFDLNGNFLIVCYTPLGLLELRKVFAFIWKKLIISKIFILVKTIERQKYEIFTFTIFLENQCEQSAPISIGTFDEESLTFKNFSMISNRRSLNKCKIPVILAPHPPAVFLDLRSGYEYDLLVQLSKDMNFTIEPTRSIIIYPYLFVGGYSPRFSTLLNLSFPSTIYESFDYVFIIPEGDLYKPFEILFLPFDFMTWILIIVTFLIGVITILIIKMMSKNVQDFVFGSNVKTPITNLWIGIYGLSQTKTPTRNFARYLLCCYLMYCLIIRTCYQSELNLFMQSDGRKPEMKTIDELIESDLFLIVDPVFQRSFNHTLSR